jgi:hypothetical protein
VQDEVKHWYRAYSTEDTNTDKNEDTYEKAYPVCRQKLKDEELLTTFVLQVQRNNNKAHSQRSYEKQEVLLKTKAG